MCFRPPDVYLEEHVCSKCDTIVPGGKTKCPKCGTDVFGNGDTDASVIPTVSHGIKIPGAPKAPGVAPAPKAPSAPKAPTL